MRIFRVLFSVLLLISSQWSFSEEWRIGVDQGFREPRLGIGFGDGALRSEFPARDLPGLDSVALPGGQRTLLEIILTGMALRRIDAEANIVLEPFSNIRRGLALLQANQLDMIGQTLSDRDVTLNIEKGQWRPKLLRTPALIRPHEFEMGVFSTANRTEILSLKDPAAFHKLRGVTVASWAGDMALMKAIVGAQLVTVPRRDMLAVAITNHRADFTFSFLSEAVVTRIGGELIRIPGFKVRVPDERAFYIGTHRRDLLQAFEALFSELRAREPDALVEALTSAGTFAPQYRNWIDLAQPAAEVTR